MNYHRLRAHAYGEQLFPSWQGTFDGARPSLAGLDNEHIIATLQHGLIAEAELTSMLHLIRSPDVRRCIIYRRLTLNAFTFAEPFFEGALVAVPFFDQPAVQISIGRRQ